MGNKTSIWYLPEGQLKLSAPWYCGPPVEILPEGNSSSGGPQHEGADSFNIHSESYEIFEIILG